VGLMTCCSCMGGRDGGMSVNSTTSIVLPIAYNMLSTRNTLQVQNGWGWMSDCLAVYMMYRQLHWCPWVGYAAAGWSGWGRTHRHTSTTSIAFHRARTDSCIDAKVLIECLSCCEIHQHPVAPSLDSTCRLYSRDLCSETAVQSREELHSINQSFIYLYNLKRYQ